MSALALDGFNVTKQDLTFYSSFKQEYQTEHKPKLCTPLDRAFLLKEQLQKRKGSNSLKRDKRRFEAKLSYRRVTESTENTHTLPIDSPEKPTPQRLTISKELPRKETMRPLSSVFHPKPALSIGVTSRHAPRSLCSTQRSRPLLPPPAVSAQSYIVMELPSKLHVSWNSQSSLEIASLTKIMTCLVVLRLADPHALKDYVTVGAVETNITGTKAGLLKGYRYTLRDLLYGLMLPSGNDASLALAVWGGRRLAAKADPDSVVLPPKKREAIGVFLGEMNRLAQLLGLKKTRYANPHGLPNSLNRSSAYDVAQLCREAMHDSLFREIVSTVSYSSSAEGPEGAVQFTWENTHRLLPKKEYAGIKTGVTDTAGSCLASHITIAGRQFLIVVLKCRSLDRRFRETEQLKRWLMKREGIGLLEPEGFDEANDSAPEEPIGDAND